MEFLSLKAQNFLTLGDITLPLNQSGLVLITGVNKDAPKANNNGSGKSSIFDAICWCLWGETTRGLSGDQVVNRRIQKDCAVSLTFEDAGDTYIVSRHRKDTRTSKPNDLLVFKNGVSLATKSKMKSMQEVIDRIVGFDFNTFCAMMPGTGVKASHMTDAQIKNLLESLLHTEQLSAAHEAVRTRLKELENQITTLALDEQRMLSEQSTLEQEMTRLQALQDSFETSKQEEIDRCTTQLEALVAEIAACDAELAKKPALKEQRDALWNEVTATMKAIGDINDGEYQRRKDFNTQLRKLELEKHSHTKDLESVRKEIRHIHDIGPSCPSCKQAVAHEHKDELLDALRYQVNVVDDQLRAVSAEIDALVAQDKAIQISKIEQTNIRVHEQTLKTDAHKIVSSALIALNSQEQLRKRAQEDLIQWEGFLVKAKALTADFAELIKAKSERIALLNDKIVTLKLNTKDLESERKLCTFWVDGFSPAGLRSFMLDYVTPILNDRASFYSELLTDGEMKIEFSTKTQLKTGDTRDKFQILVTQEHGSDLYKGTSTGERARADLVISMTLGDLAAFRTAKQLPWRFLDEPFESIDDAGIDAIVRLLNDQKARYKTVFVVTHKSSFKQLFTQQITVVKENGISRLQDEDT